MISGNALIKTIHVGDLEPSPDVLYSVWAFPNIISFIFTSPKGFLQLIKIF